MNGRWLPMSLFLSGGLDSSSLVAFAKQAVPDRKIQCFTIGFKGNIALEEGMIDGAYTIFALICIELWCRIFIDSRS
ncbi:MAG: asparagine synthase-related protein [Nitrospiria bacterium]